MGTEYIVFAFVLDDAKLPYRYKIDLTFIAFQGTSIIFLMWKKLELFL